MSNRDSENYSRTRCRLLAVKNNQEKLRKAVEAAFATQRETTPECTTAEQGDGRIEALDGNLSRCKGMNSIVMVENFRYKKAKRQSKQQAQLESIEA